MSMVGASVLVVAALLMLGSRMVDRPVWPGEDWQVASPESQGLSSEMLDKAADYAMAHGGGSGCVIRFGYLVKEWGSRTTLADIKSATKGIMGATALGIAVDSGLVRLDDPACKYYPQIGRERPENIKTGWLERITVRHLATMTAGFDDGRPPLLVYEPGTSGIYSNDTSNMLAELLTLQFKEDLYTVMKRKVMDPIGVPPDEWSWRDNAYRPDTVGGLKSREFASGIKITHRAMARIGYLYLRQGRWKDRQIISSEFIRLATQPSDLPTPWPYYGFYWGTNGRGTFKEIPRDTFWALGLGDSMVIVCPSLDLVVVRLGVGSADSHLPGGEEWGVRVAGFFKIIVDAVREPYPLSDVIKGVRWAPPEQIIRKAHGSDNWPVTWADDDNLYTAYGDGWGFEPKVPKKLSLGIAKVSGSPPDIKGVNIRSETAEQVGDGRAGKKASGMLMVDGVLYMWVRNAGNSQLAWSADHGRTWTWCDWKFTKSFGCPTFLNFGKNYSGARDDYVYIYSPDSDTAYDPADRMVLARVPKDRITQREAYEFFKGLDDQGRPLWTKDIDQRGPVFVHPGRCLRGGITYNPGLKRYLWCQVIPGGDTRFEGGFGIYDAPEPWGPWTTVYFTEKWDVGPGESSCLPVKWMSADGRTCHLVFSGDDSFSVRKVTFETQERPGDTQAAAHPAPKRRTRISIVNGKWHINGKVTYPGSRAEGLLMNVRMVNCVFEDRNRSDFDPEANTSRFISALPDYVAQGIRAFTICLQGGMPGYEGALNSAFNPDGSLRPSYMSRVARVIEACDDLGAAVILGCFYQRQDQVLRDEQAVRSAVVNVVNWIKRNGFTNVLLEIANEFPHRGFDHRIVRTAKGQVELIRLAKRAAPDLLVSTSGVGNGRYPVTVARAVDFILIHFNSTPVEEIPKRIAGLKRYGKPIVCNEDDKIGEQGARAAEICVANGCSWGFMHSRVNQHFPFEFNGHRDDPIVYAAIRKLTGAAGGR